MLEPGGLCQGMVTPWASFPHCKGGHLTSASPRTYGDDRLGRAVRGAQVSPGYLLTVQLSGTSTSACLGPVVWWRGRGSGVGKGSWDECLQAN